MFVSSELNNHLKTTDTIKTKSVVLVEWNMNDPENIKRLGNYRYRPSHSQSPYYLLPSNYQDIETGPTYYYTGATDSDTVIESGLNDQDQPTLFLSPQTKMKMLFSLEECIKPFRPRSGINKLLYLGGTNNSSSSNQYIDDPRSEAARRPRYYMASKDDQFKYWTSFRKELGVPTPIPGIVFPQVQKEVIRGVSFSYLNQGNYIEDAVPFVVYQEEVPTNKIVVKMQTNVGEVSIGSSRYGNATNVQDPLYGTENQTTPVIWRIEVLKNNSWETATAFDSNSTKEDGSPLIGADGYVEISYGLNVPNEFKNNFYLLGELPNSSILPDFALDGDAYLIKENDQDKGEIYIWKSEEWQSFVPEYAWSISSEEFNSNTKLVSKLSNPDFYIENDSNVYREFEFISGIRIVVETMNKPNCTFDLIEFSPRLVADISDIVSSFSISKKLSDLGNSSIPVGDLFASTGGIDILDTDFIFNENNTFNKSLGTGSLISKYLSNMAKFIFYEQVLDNDNVDYYIPLKTMYSFGFPQASSVAASISTELRDLFFLLEYSKAPQLLLTEVSLSYAIMTLLDFVGFDNYVFKRISNKPELIIPYFFVQPGQNVAEVLRQLAIASQSAMFFDEYNNLVIMSKEYLLPESEDQRETNNALIGQEVIYDVEGNSFIYLGEIYDESDLPEEKYSGAFLNYSNNKLYVWDEQSNGWEDTFELDRIDQPNIVSFASKDKKVYNDGQINYTTRYLQRSVPYEEVMPIIDMYKNFVYKPVLLWEVEGKQVTKTINELAGQMGGYSLGAMPLNSDLTSELPYVASNQLFNNIIDVGENVYWMTSYQGYLYANAEIIKYDAIEYIVSGEASPVWITSNQQYQEYFGRLKFNGKMYPTGRVRIYTDPEFEKIDGRIVMKDANPVKIHGRGQFGTEVVSHSAGLNNDSYWTNPSYVRGCYQQASSYLFNVSDYISYPSPLNNNNAGLQLPSGTPGYSSSNLLAQKSSRGGIINNHMAYKSFTETELSYKKTTDPGTVQSSALVFTGPPVPNPMNPANFISYVYKDFLDSNGASIPYKHYGTRMRVVGKIESGTNKSQTPNGLFSLFTGSGSSSPSSTTNSNDQEVIISGGSGGIAINIDKEKNTGYYFEIAALTVDNIDKYISDNTSTKVMANIVSSPAPSSTNGVVTVWTENEIDWQVGQPVIITGLVDSANPTNANTPLNGSYTITAISSNKKQFQYNIGTSLTTTSQTGGKATIDIATNTNFANIFFYKVVADSSGNAIPYKLWSGLSKINVDSGELTGQARLLAEDNTTVYDLAAEYMNTGKSRKFYLYINNKQIAVVEDESPLPEKNSMALFVRGSSKCMFENVYALSHNYSQNSIFPIQAPVSEIFGDSQIDATEAFRKYAISGMIQKTYLSGISSLSDPQYKMYFEEFGTIFREAAYFNVLYDRAYPALMAKLDKTINNIKGYSTSGFYAWSYGAEFLIFNCTDFVLNLDDTSGNYLRIIGNAFTQSTTYTLTVDDLYKKRENLLDSALGKDVTLYNPLAVSQEYNKILNSRTKFGKNEITIDSPYIQTDSAAEDIFGWVISKTFSPKKSVGVNVYGTENLQLGDIVTIKYTSNEGIDVVTDEDTRFVIYQIDYSKQESGPATVMYLAEV